MKKLLLSAILLCGIVMFTMQTKGSAKNAGRPKSEPVYLVVKSRADQNQIFSYHPYPAFENEIRFSKITGTGMYRLTVDAQGAVTQIQILKRFSGSHPGRGGPGESGFFPGFDKLMLQTLIRWRAKPGPLRVVDIYLSFG